MSIAARIFEERVEGAIRFARWLLAVAPGAEEKLDARYNEWGLAFLGAPVWRNAAVAGVELGWALSGAGRAIVDVAMKRAAFWATGESDIYGAVFRRAHNCPT